MTAPAPTREGWSTRRWAAVVALLFGLHAGLIVLLEENAAPIPRANPAGLAVAMVLDPAASRQLLDAFAVSDPTLLPLGQTRRGAVPMWQNFSPSEQRLQEAVASTAALAQPEARLGGVFGDFVRTNLAAPAPVPDRPAPPAALPPPIANSPAASSTLRIQGALAVRPLLGSVQPRSWLHTNLLAPSSVQVLVNDAGEVFSPRLLEGGGAPDAVQRAADQHAVELARSLHFAPRAGTGAAFTAGLLVFHWQVNPPPPAGLKRPTP